MVLLVFKTSRGAALLSLVGSIPTHSRQQLRLPTTEVFIVFAGTNIKKPAGYCSKKDRQNIYIMVTCFLSFNISAGT